MHNCTYTQSSIVHNLDYFKMFCVKSSCEHICGERALLVSILRNEWCQIFGPNRKSPAQTPQTLATTVVAFHGLQSSARLLGAKELLNCENQPEHRKIYRKKLSFRYFMGNKRGAVLRFPPDLPPFLQDTAPCSLSGPNSIMILHSHISYLSNIIYVILIYVYLTTCPLFHQTLTLRNT